MFRIVFAITFLTLLSCNGNETADKMREIKAIGDKDPKLAMKMLDSAYTESVNVSEYTRMKYELLRVRLSNKNNTAQTSNRMVEVLTDYFSHNGTVQEKQEAYFYAGSAYCDRDDIPKAIENFYKSVEATKENGQCDTILLKDAYSNLFYLLTNVLDDNTAQKLITTVNNKYKYNLDRKYVHKVEWERMLYASATGVMSSICLLLTLAFAMFYIKKKKNILRQQLTIVGELRDAEKRCQTMQEELAEKTRQNQSLMQMLHRTEISTNAEDEIAIVKEAALGRRKLETGDWQRLYAAVDSLYPGFRDSIVAHLGKFTEQQMQVCYLMCIGLDNPQIKNVSDIPRTTIWRWTKACEWIYKMREEKTLA